MTKENNQIIAVKFRLIIQTKSMGRLDKLRVNFVYWKYI